MTIKFLYKDKGGEKEVIEDSSNQFLRKMVIPIPESLKEKLPRYKSIRIGYNHSELAIYVCLIPKKMNGYYDLACSKECRATGIGLVNEAKALAKDEPGLEMLLNEFIRERYSIGRLNYSP